MMLRNLDRWVRQMREDLATLEIPQAVEDAFGPYQDGPVRFAREVLGVKYIPRYQERFMRDVAQHDRVAWVAGHATGKSHAAAMLLAWYLVTRPHCRCIVTSATFERQVGRVIFAKLRGMVARAKVELPIEVTATRAQVAEHSEWGAEGVPSSRPENFAGFHATQMLVIADEAKALERPVLDELMGVLASATDEARLVLISTAGPAAGFFYERFERHAETWKLHRTPSTKSRFATGYAERMLQECYGVDDPVYRMRVLAEFASDVEGQLIPLTAIHAAIGREFSDPEADEKAGTVLGVDLARFGDDRSVLCVRRGRRIESLAEWRKFDLMASATRVSSELNARGRGTKAAIDVAGLGAGCYDRLRQLGHQDVQPINVAARSSKPDTFANLRAELGWMVRGHFERGEISIPDHPGLVSELAALRYGYDRQGRILLEPKDEAKSRLGRSPDLADALTLALTAVESGRVMFGEIQDQLHAVESREPADWTVKELAVHWGYGDGAHVVWIETGSGITGPPRSWVYREFATTETPPSILAQMIVERTPRNEKIERVVIGDAEEAWGTPQDSGPSPAEQMLPALRTRDWRVIPATKGAGSQRRGWMLLHTYFYPERAGGPLLRVTRDCPALWHQLTSLLKGIPPHDVEDLEPHQADQAVRALAYWAQGRPDIAPPTEADLVAADPDADKLVDPRSYEVAQIERLRRIGFPAVPVRRPPTRKRPKQHRRPW